MNAPYVEVRGLKKSFGLKPVLRGLDLTIPRGKRLALLGANGTGKTTFLRILAGLIRPSEGSASVDGLDIVRDAQQVRRLVGFVAHQPYLYDELTALENLLFFGRMYTVPRREQRARELLNRVGLARKAGERVCTLSRGQLQRLALARALLHSPQLLLLDEPDAGLDEEGNALLETLLNEHAAQGGTTLFTTHALERALKLSDDVALMRRGRVGYQQETAMLEIDSMRRVYQEAIK